MNTNNLNYNLIRQSENNATEHKQYNENIDVRNTFLFSPAFPYQRLQNLFIKLLKLQKSPSSPLALILAYAAC